MADLRVTGEEAVVLVRNTKAAAAGEAIASAMSTVASKAAAVVDDPGPTMAHTVDDTRASIATAMNTVDSKARAIAAGAQRNTDEARIGAARTADAGPLSSAMNTAGSKDMAGEAATKSAIEAAGHAGSRSAMNTGASSPAGAVAGQITMRATTKAAATHPAATVDRTGMKANTRAAATPVNIVSATMKVDLPARAADHTTNGMKINS